MRFTLNSTLQLYIVNIWNWITNRKSKSIQIFIEPHRISSSSHIEITDIHDFVNIIVTKAPKKIFLEKMKFFNRRRENRKVSNFRSTFILFNPFYLHNIFFWIISEEVVCFLNNEDKVHGNLLMQMVNICRYIFLSEGVRSFIFGMWYCDDWYSMDY